VAREAKKVAHPCSRRSFVINSEPDFSQGILSVPGIAGYKGLPAIPILLK